MARASATERDPADRLTSSDRREALLDATLAIVLEHGTDAVTMGTVADRSEVTRGLVYKHFANKEELLSALHLREATRIDREIRHKIAAADDGFVPKFSVYVTAVVEGVADTSHLFDPLRAASAHTGTAGAQSSWDRRTVKYFAELAAAEFGISEAEARTAVTLLLGGMANLFQLVRSNPRSRRTALEQQYVRLVIGALSSLRAR